MKRQQNWSSWNLEQKKKKKKSNMTFLKLNRPSQETSSKQNPRISDLMIKTREQPEDKRAFLLPWRKCTTIIAAKMRWLATTSQTPVYNNWWSVGWVSTKICLQAEHGKQTRQFEAVYGCGLRDTVSSIILPHLGRQTSAAAGGQGLRHYLVTGMTQRFYDSGRNVNCDTFFTS